MKKTVNWGVLGTAVIATGRTMPALKGSSSATLLALASRDAAKGRAVAQELGVPRVYVGYDALLADPDIDAVYVPLPNHLHFEWSVRALEAGKHVLCEKPLCLTSGEVAQLCAVRDRTGRHIEEAFAFRNHPQWEKLEEILATNAIGTVRAVHGTLAKQFFDPADIDRLTSALLDYGDRHATFTVASQSGPAAWATHQHLSVLGASGWLRFNFPLAHAHPTACSIELGDATSVGSLPTATFRFEPVNQYAGQVDRFSRLLLGHDVPSWPIEDALGTLRTIEALFESARSGAWQSLPE